MKYPNQGNEMRFALAVMAVFLTISVSGAAQSQPNPYKVKSSKVETEPKSTANVKVPTATASSTTSKELQSVERENPKGTAAAHTAKKTPKPVAMKPDAKENRNPPMNFGGKGGNTGSSMTKQSSPYKGRLKQKGQGGHN
jgi:LAS superfamily LD-carboxypeptidase LdcB